ncbi:MAG: amidohydrolase family protein, partial [Cellvibrionaceae bacterium]|nr:amidohydrolase family protein [Cellvibrionaceae bacterium]
WELDQVSKDKPVFIRHVSGHLGVCNSRCLELAHIDKNTPNPEGGVFRRKPDTNIPNGVMEESALHNVTHVIPSPSLQQQLERLTELDRYYAQYGITTVQDGATSSKGLALLQAAAKGKHLSLDVIAYPYYAWTDLDKFLPSSGPGKDYNNGFRIAGVKLVLDGSPQGKTAWLSHPYHEPPEGLPKDYKGYPILKDEQLKETLGGFYSKGYQILAHANGDAAAEQMLRIMDKLKAEQKHQPRSVMIHAQTVRDDQLDRM